LFFGILRDLAGRGEDKAALAEGATLDDLFAHYERLYPRLGGMKASIVLARNQRFEPRETPLGEGDEVAFLPPVSGGTGIWTQAVDTPEGSFFALTRQPIDTRALAARVERASDGAVVTFEGVVRDNTKGRATLYLDYDCYEALAIRTMQEIGQELAAEFSLGRIAIVHRLGRMEIGEASVVIVVAAPHRQPAFAAALEAINRLKRMVPIWKKEYFAGGEVWVEGEWDASLLPR
jgi:molybdopterin synthase catalytic subunit